MIGPPQVIAEATDCAGLVDAFRARKEALGLSNEALEHLLQLSGGHVDKLLGPSRERGLSGVTLDVMLSGLGLKLLVAIDPAGVERWAPRWASAGHRDAKQVRDTPRIAKALIARARPFVLREAAARASRARWGRVSPELRSALMREVSLARWHPHANASEPAAQQETAQ
jgi:hypothetical protein